MNDQTLIEAALAARVKAYAPYSKFLVGAAVLSEAGEVFSGCNVENASYGMTICAERVAVFKAVSAGHTKLTRLALATAGGYAPCGGCLQVLAEFCDDLEILVLDANDAQSIARCRLSDLLPRRFRL